MDITSLIIEAVGGNVAGAAMTPNSLGAVGNSSAGIVGGGLGGTILQMVMGTAAAGGGGLRPAEHPDQRGRRRCGRRHPHGHHRHHQEQDGGKVATLTAEIPQDLKGTRRFDHEAHLPAFGRCRFFAEPFHDNQFLSAVRGALAVQQ
jgi:uncharacterized membrane protein YeaQ/YmgE (transglycosylase-associated protein family)